MAATRLVGLGRTGAEMTTRSPATAVADAAVEQKFRELAEQWRRETGGYSLLSRIVDHPAYREIVAMGEMALSPIFADLQQEPDHWFTALREITGADPVPEADRGRLDAMRDHWLQWGRENGYVS